MVKRRHKKTILRPKNAASSSLSWARFKLHRHSGHVWAVRNQSAKHCLEKMQSGRGLHKVQMISLPKRHEKKMWHIYIISHIYRYTPLCRAGLFLQPNSLIKHHKPTGPTAISTFATNLLAYGRRDSDEDTAPKRFDPTQ